VIKIQLLQEEILFQIIKKRNFYDKGFDCWYQILWGCLPIETFHEEFSVRRRLGNSIHSEFGSM